MPDLIPRNVKKKLEDECKKIAKKAGKKIKPDAVGDKAEDAIKEHVCAEVKNVDKKIVELVVGELKKQLEKDKAKQKQPAVPSPDAKPVGTLKPPGSGVPSITIPITDFVLDKKLDTKGKFELKVWADPRDLQKKDKGVMLNFSVVNW